MLRVSLQAAVSLKARFEVAGEANMEQAHRWCGDRQNSSALLLTPSRVHWLHASSDHTRNILQYTEAVRSALCCLVLQVSLCFDEEKYSKYPKQDVVRDRYVEDNKACDNNKKIAKEGKPLSP